MGRKRHGEKIRERLDTLRRNIGKWILGAIVCAVVVFTLFIMGRNVTSIVRSYIAVRHLHEEKALYENSIRDDSILLERLSHDEYIEKYAREKYHMQRDGEEVFLVDDND